MRRTHAARLAVCLALAAVVAIMPSRRHLAAGAAPRGGQPCASTGSSQTGTSITAPPDQGAYSSTVPLAVQPPTGAVDYVNVCASYQFVVGQQETVLIATLGNGTGSWAAMWDASALPSQSGITLTFLAHDPTGQLSPIGQRIVTIDRAPPVSALTIVGPRQYTARDGTIYVANSTPISLTAADPPLDDGSPSSGATIYYSVDGGPASVFNQPFTLDAWSDGPHTISYWAVDAAGNAEAPHSITLVLATNPPVVTPLIVPPLQPDGSASGPVAVSFTVIAGADGLSSFTYSLQPACENTGQAAYCNLPYTIGQTIAVTDSQQVEYVATDHLGNFANGIVSITIATPTPIPTAASPTPTAPAGSPTPDVTTSPPASPTATRTPRPAPTWPPIDGPPLLNRAAVRLVIPAAAPAGLVIHLHVMPAAPRARRAAPRKRQAHARTGHAQKGVGT